VEDSTSARNLVSDSQNSEKEASVNIDLYYILMTISHIGGFLFFFKSIFCFALSAFSSVIFRIEILNKQIDLKRSEEMKMRKMFSSQRNSNSDSKTLNEANNKSGRQLFLTFQSNLATSEEKELMKRE
jgi:hypothetical protein